MTKLVIFDLDGTLLNTIDDLAGACNYALDKCGYPARRAEEYNTLVGRGIYNLFRGALPEGAKDEENVERMAEIFIPYYDAHKCDMTRPYDGIIQLLSSLEKAGIKFAIASNKYQEGAEGVAAEYFGQFDFLKVLGQREGFPIKPSPDIVYEIMASAEGIEKDEVIYVGDSNVDMETGINAGVRTVGVTWGFRTREELASFNPWKLADTPEELLDYIIN